VESFATISKIVKAKLVYLLIHQNPAFTPHINSNSSIQKAWERVKLRRKILIGYGLVLALIVTVCVLAVVNLHDLGQASASILQENYRSILAAQSMMDAIERQNSATLLVLLGYDPEGQHLFREHEVAFLEWLGRAKDNITISGEELLIKSLQTAYEDYLSTFSQLIELLPNPAPKPSTDYYHQILFPPFQEVRYVCVKLLELNQQAMLAASERTQAVSTRAIWSMTLMSTVAVSSGLAFSLLLSTFLVQPLQQMSRASERIAEGDYEVLIPVRSQDELGSLAHKIMAMSRKLKEFHDLNVGKLMAAKQRSEAIISSITDGIIVVDAYAKIIAINPKAAQLFNTSPQLAQGQHFFDVFENRELYDPIKTTALTGMTPLLSDEQSILSLGDENQTHYYKFSITPVKTEDDQMLGVVLVLQDVTKLKQLDQLKTQFVMTASHELRTPLSSILMSIDLLIESTRSKLSEREQVLLKAAQEDVQRLRVLVNDLLDLGKIESGRMDMELESVSMGVLLQKAITLFSVQAKESDVELLLQMPEEPFNVKADANKIIWVLTNLIANALRYTDAGGHIRVSARRHGDFASVSVADDGPGIPVEYQSRIFDKFVQVQTNRDIGGSGLGLAISLEIVKAHGGRIWVDSKLNSGSTFNFTLPIVVTHPIQRMQGEQNDGQS
jgi:NtrC-family two-component system sensor histidine kinase KinB